MKKLLPWAKPSLLLFALLLIACQTSTVETNPCATPDGTYPISYTETWNQVTYQLPWCWSMDDSATEQLMLKDGDSENFVQMSTFELEIVEGPTVETMRTSPTGTPLYIYVLNSEDSQTQLILDSIQWIETPDQVTGSCDAPDGTYPELTYQSWSGLEYALPWCWTAVEEGDSLSMKHGEGEAWVGIVLSTTDALPKELPTPTRTDYEEFSQFSYGGYVYLETDEPERSDVQSIIHSLSPL